MLFRKKNLEASTFALKFQEKVRASLFGLGQELSDPCVSSKPISLQAEQGERRRDTPFWMRFKKILLQPKSSTTTGFNTEADDLT